MKVCPKCNKKYDDETLNFCLDDGSVLDSAGAEISEEPPPTVMMPQAPPTTPGDSPGTQPTQQIWETAPRYQSPAASGSKTWIWIIGIMGAVVVLCGGGFLGLIAIGSFVDDGDSPPVTKEETEPPRIKAPREDRKLEATDDFEEWDIKGNEYISARKRSGELILTSVKGYYYVIMTRTFETENASVKLTVRNTTGGASDLGYGLVVHGDPWDVLADDYAFLIRSDKQQFRVVRHLKKEERTLIDWTDFSEIRKGSGLNELEVRANGRDMDFYINGFFAVKEKDVSKKRFFLQSQEKGEKRTAGIYTSGNIPIGFSKFEYRK